MKINAEIEIDVDTEFIEKKAGYEQLESLIKRALSGELEKEFLTELTGDWEDEATKLKLINFTVTV